MKNNKVLAISVILVLMFSAAGLVYTNVIARPMGADSPGLGAAESFSVLGETLISNVPTSTIGRDVGLSPSTGTGIGLTDGEVGGIIYSVDANAPAAANATINPGLLTDAINAMMTTYTNLDQPCTTSYAGVQDLTIVSPLSAGVYCADAFLLTGNLTLSGSGVWIFKSSATLTTSAGSSVTGGDPCNVWWRLVSDADLGSNSSMIGNILAGTLINMQNGASLNGRALAQAAVTLSANTISGPSCVAAAAVVDAAPAVASGPDNPQPESGSTEAFIGTATALASTPRAGVPSTGGGPIQSDGSLWILAGIIGLSTVALVLAIRKVRQIFESK